MRILFVTPYVPSRIRVRPFHFIQSLSAAHEVSLVSLLCDDYEREMVQEVAGYCASVDLVPLPRLRAYTNCVRALPTLMPLRVAYYQSPALVQRVRHVIAHNAIQVVHGELIKVVPALRAVMTRPAVAASGAIGVPMLYDAVDCISYYLQQQYSSARNPLQQAFVYSELLKMRRYEPRSLAAFGKVVITSAHDRAILVELGLDAEHIEVVANGVDTHYFTPPTTSRTQDSLVFCAKMDYYPNSQAILRFCSDTLPLIWKRRPQVRLTIVGNHPPQAVRDLARDERITVTGFVPDIRPYLAAASVALAPLIVAAGMQNKVLEALAMGTPTVSTSASCRSLQVTHEVQLLIADGAQDFAQAVLRLLDDSAFAQSLALAGREFVEQRHSWMAAAHTLSDLYSGIITEHRQLEPLVPTKAAFRP